MLQALSEVLAARKGADPKASYVARLYAEPDKLRKKIAEEAAELLLASKDQARAGIVHEAADLLFHLLVLLAHHDVPHLEVFDELARRFGASGVSEKRMRDAHADYGPLAMLAGLWEGEKGEDVAPAPDGAVKEAYRETIRFVPVGEVVNAKSQHLWALFYHQKVQKLADGAPFHDQCGYWAWDPESGRVYHSFVIPRQAGYVAEGTAENTDEGVRIAVRTGQEGIAQSGFLAGHARTLAFAMSLEVRRDALSYAQTTELEIYGERFSHTDRNTLRRIS